MHIALREIPQRGSSDRSVGGPGGRTATMYTKEEYGFSFSPLKMAISLISKRVPLESMHACKNCTFEEEDVLLLRVWHSYAAGEK